jgi:CBS domain-containing protein
MNVQDIMTPRPATASPAQPLLQVAKLMRDGNYGIVPVEDNGHLIGVLTDRDIVVRAIAQGKAPDQCTVKEVMTTEVFHVAAGDSLEDAERCMSEHQVRRLPVVDGQRLVGMISLGDIALEHPSSAGHTLQDVAKPMLNRASGFAATD